MCALARDRRIVRRSPPPSDCTVDTAAESYHQHLVPFRKKTSTPEKCRLEPNQNENSGANPVSARVFGAARDVGDRQPLPPFACSDPKPTNIIPGSHHSEAVSEFHKDRILSTAD